MSCFWICYLVSSIMPNYYRSQIPILPSVISYHRHDKASDGRGLASSTCNDDLASLCFIFLNTTISVRTTVHTIELEYDYATDPTILTTSYRVSITVWKIVYYEIVVYIYIGLRIVSLSVKPHLILEIISDRRDKSQYISLKTVLYTTTVGS